MKEIKLYKSPWKAIKLLLLCTIFVLGGILIINSTDSPEWVGWMSICFFGLGYPIGFFNLLDRRPQIIINEIGIWDRKIKQEIIHWGIIQNTYLSALHEQKCICIQVDPSYEPSNKQGKWYKNAIKINKALGFQELNVSLGQINVDEKGLADFIYSMSQVGTEERLIKIKTFVQQGV